MSVRPAQAQSMIPRPGVAARGAPVSPARDEKTNAAGKPAPGFGNPAKAAAAQAKGGLQGGGAESARSEGAGAAESTQVGAPPLGLGNADSLEGGAGRGRFELLQGESRPAPAQPAARLSLLTVQPEPMQERVARREDSSAPHQALHGRATLRARVMELLLQGMADMHGQLSHFLENPHGLGAVNLSRVLSESSVTMELWGPAREHVGSRLSLARSLGVGMEADEARVLRLLMLEVHELFVEFQASRSGREAQARYEEVLRRCEDIQVLPVVPGHDTGPMLFELARLGLAPTEHFTRSLFVNPLLVAVGLAPDEGQDTQVMVAGLEVLDLATLVAQLRQLNPQLSNRQVLHLLRQASTDLKNRKRKALGALEMEQVQHCARQLLRLQVVRNLHC